MLAIDGEYPVGHPKDKCWQLQKISCATFVRSSIVNEVIKTISSQLFWFFLRKTFEHIKSTKTISNLLEIFVRAKNCCLLLPFAVVDFFSINFVLLVDLCL